MSTQKSIHKHAESKRQMFRRLHDEDGMTYDEIGEAFGISRQRVAQMIGKPSKHHFVAARYKNIAYVGLRAYMITNHVSWTELYRRMPNVVYSPDMQYKLSKNLREANERAITLYQIRRLLDVTGLTFEEAFGKVELPEKTRNDDEQEDAGTDE